MWTSRSTPTPASVEEVSRSETKETGAWRCSDSSSSSSSSVAVRAWQEVGARGIKRFGINCSEASAKCCFPRSLLGPEARRLWNWRRPECLRQCERRGRVGTGSRRSAASHQCRLTDGSIQHATTQRLQKNTRRSHMKRWRGREADSFSRSSSLQRYFDSTLPLSGDLNPSRPAPKRLFERQEAVQRQTFPASSTNNQWIY